MIRKKYDAKQIKEKAKKYVNTTCRSIALRFLAFLVSPSYIVAVVIGLSAYFFSDQGC